MGKAMCDALASSDSNSRSRSSIAELTPFDSLIFDCLILFLAGGKVNISDGGATPLHIAADNGSLELINCLLKAGTDPNISDECLESTDSRNSIVLRVPKHY
ncbi:unnamed protein product [Lupinus luteus]|uniref:Uncharacterized protein n=1 Tax=Lupinus luteus TaxID=3873 RepID=A0AAV1WUP6_LUPLU